MHTLQDVKRGHRDVVLNLCSSAAIRQTNARQGRANRLAGPASGNCRCAFHVLVSA